MADKLSGSAIQPGTISITQISGTFSNTVNTAANTVRVSANSGSTLSNKQINFINTSSIIVSVTENSGNANISFSAAGGGTPDYIIQSYGIT